MKKTLEEIRALSDHELGEAIAKDRLGWEKKPTTNPEEIRALNADGLGEAIVTNPAGSRPAEQWHGPGDYGLVQGRKWFCTWASDEANQRRERRFAVTNLAGTRPNLGKPVLSLVLT